MTGNEALRDALPVLRAAGVADALRDARLILAHVTGIAPDRVALHLHQALSGAEVDAFDLAIAARAARQPVSQITGSRRFWGRNFHVTQDTLDPRPETETLVAEALARPFHQMLDLGTGTGCILLSCLAERPMATGTGCDISDAALVVAQQNAASLGIQTRARFLRSDWFDAIPGRFDLIVSNPPYVTQSEMANLAPEVRNWEPLAALTPGGDGLGAYRVIARGAGARLVAGGRLLLEIGPSQAAAVAALLVAEGFGAIRVLQDLDGRDRVVVALRPAGSDLCGIA